MDDLTCEVCSEVYETTVREPVMLPKCGHTFCRSCLSNLQNMTQSLKCPTCRTSHIGPSVANMPPVYIVLNILDKNKRDNGTVNVCKRHDDPVRLWCRSCQEELCGQCLFEQHMSEGHDIVETHTAVEEMKQTIEMQADQLTGCINKEKSQLVQELHHIAHQLGKLYNKSQTLSDNSKIIQDILQVAKATNQIKTLVVNQSILQNMIRDLRTQSETKETFPLTEEYPSSPPTIPTQNENGQQCSETHTFQSNVNEKRSTKDELPEIEDRNPVADELENDDDDSDSSQDDSQHIRAHQAGSHNSRSQLNLSSDVSLWPLTCHAPGGRTDWPKINWYNFLMQVPVVQLLVPPENPQIFLQLSVKGKILGCIQIRLWGYLRRAQHFLALCLGTLGPCYRGSKFSHVAKRGEPGERLIGGFYEIEEGYTGHQVIEGLEWRGEYTGPMRAGVIGGSRGRQPKYNSCFCISTRDYPHGKYYCPFGEVISGLEVAQEAVKYEPVSEVTITDTGLVPPHYHL